MSKKLIWYSLISIIMISFTTWIFITLYESEEPIRTADTVTNFALKTAPSGSDSQYNIELTMNEEGNFHIETSVIIRNISKDSWSELVFYFIPNMFTENTSLDLNRSLEVPSTVNLHKVTLNGEQADYNLDKDTLTVSLSKKLEPGNDIKVDFTYDFTLPEEGLRFTKNNENYYLAQFYPMVATYRDHQWNKEDYRFRGETYHTAFSDFKVKYEVPDGYTVASSSDSDQYPGPSNNTFEVNHVKEMFIAILYQPKVIQKMEEDITIRVVGFEENEDLYKEISEVASDALRYFQKNIGPYPFTQLDIIVDELGMEYPGIVTANSVYGSGPVNPNALKNMVVHEIAHQWFYGVISNDPYNDAWLDEGFANFATGLYNLSGSNQEVPYETMNKQLEDLEPLPVNLPLDEYDRNMSSYVYGKSSTMLWKLFEQNDGIKGAEKFLKTYYDHYKYKEVDTEEFVRFSKHYFDLEDDSFFREWFLLE
ncbi:M1 family metallopeptidase [Lentibacillus sp. CBA3610]|uniref:M1 family metallopeptidase n=1 Tax=Lentibacillus sp. CBA3610 TaxID=2518176 RepID=UPI001595F520|nr:M1 family metallopeptidase [Lentibacillus sp. CBA3610]QKY71013.1 M1 family peptidase [Lentibacillus sp. CBA3610]